MNTTVWGMRFLVTLSLVLVGSAAIGGTATASTAVPYTDPNSVGYIGLCNQAGQQITSGSVSTTPFAWRAVSSQPARSPYNNAWRTAILLAYQPQQELVPGEWSGEGMTASSRYTNPANPMAAATDADDSLEDFLQDYPANWDGFVELRMYLGTQNEQAYSLHYPTLNIQVTGDTWQAVGGGPVNCASGTSESVESILVPGKTTTTTTTAPSTTSGNKVSVAGATGTSVPPSGGSGTSGSQATGTGPHGDASPALASSTRTNGHPWIIGVIVAVLIALAALAFLIIRRRRSSHPPTAPITSNS